MKRAVMGDEHGCGCSSEKTAKKDAKMESGCCKDEPSKGKKMDSCCQEEQEEQWGGGGCCQG